MLVRYLVQLRDPIILEDSWPIAIRGGTVQTISKDGKIIAIEVRFPNQDPNLSPAYEKAKERDVAFNIIGRDKLLPFIKMQLEDAFSYLQCCFNVELLIDEISAEYVAETKVEEDLINISSFTFGREKPVPAVPYDLFTRAMIAAENGPGPRLEANFIRMSRAELFNERYIDSFRYSFLLIESTYGDGKFKSQQLKAALGNNSEFVSFVERALEERIVPRGNNSSDTEKLLSSGPSIEDVIGHIVDKRGFYFHGNNKGKDIWKPHEQETAESLCLLSLSIASMIAFQAAGRMFDPALSKRHLEGAQSAGAIMTMKVNYRFRNNGETFDREGTISMNVPGTRVTPKLAVSVASEFLKEVPGLVPSADIKSAKCIDARTGNVVFDIRIHV